MDTSFSINLIAKATAFKALVEAIGKVEADFIDSLGLVVFYTNCGVTYAVRTEIKTFRLAVLIGVNLLIS